MYCHKLSLDNHLTKNAYQAEELFVKANREDRIIYLERDRSHAPLLTVQESSFYRSVKCLITADPKHSP